MSKILIIFSSLLLIACGQEKSAPSESEYIEFSYDDIAFKVERNRLTFHGKELVEAVLAKKSESEIIDLMIEQVIVEHSYVAKQDISADSIRQFIDQVDVSKVQNPYDLKFAIEQAVDKKFESALKYNIEMASMGDIINENQMQCFSGSMLYTVLAYKNQTQVSLLKTPLLLSRPRHLLPGFIGPSEDGELHLYGVDTIYSGKGEVDFGPIKNELPSELIVVEAKYLLLSHILKSALVDIDDLRNSIIQKTKENLNLKYKEDAWNIFDDVSLDYIRQTYNASIFLFGKSSPPTGAVERPQMNSYVVKEHLIPNNESITYEDETGLDSIKLEVSEKSLEKHISEEE